MASSVCTPDCISCTEGSEYFVQRRFCRVPHQFAHLTVYLVQRGQNILYKGALGRLVRLRPLELACGGLEVDVTPQPACKLLGVHCSPIHVTVQLSEGQQGERPARLAGSKGHIALDGVNLHKQNLVYHVHLIYSSFDSFQSCLTRRSSETMRTSSHHVCLTTCPADIESFQCA